MLLLKVNRTSCFSRIVILLLSMVVVACSGGSKEKTQFRDTARGVWQTDCLNLGLQREYSRTSLTVDETSFEFQNDFFEDPLCRRPTLSLSTTGTLIEHKSTRTEDGIALSAIDFSLEQVVLSVSTQATADRNNATALCGRFDWQPDVIVDVSNCSDIAGSVVPRTDFDIYSTGVAIDSDGEQREVIYTGAMPGNTEETRPAMPDIFTPYWLVAPLPQPSP